MGEYYRTTCGTCGHVRAWVGYKTAIGKSKAQLDWQRTQETVCEKCGGPARTGLDGAALPNAAVGKILEATHREVDARPPEPRPPAPVDAAVDRGHGADAR